MLTCGGVAGSYVLYRFTKMVRDRFDDIAQQHFAPAMPSDLRGMVGIVT